MSHAASVARSASSRPRPSVPDVAGDRVHAALGHLVEPGTAQRLAEAVEGVVAEDLPLDPLRGGGPAPGPHQQHQLAVRHLAQQALDEGGADEAGRPGDGDALAGQGFGDHRRSLRLTASVYHVCLPCGRERRRGRLDGVPGPADAPADPRRRAGSVRHAGVRGRLAGRHRGRGRRGQADRPLLVPLQGRPARRRPAAHGRRAGRQHRGRRARRARRTAGPGRRGGEGRVPAGGAASGPARSCSGGEPARPAAVRPAAAAGPPPRGGRHRVHGQGDGGGPAAAGRPAARPVARLRHGGRHRHRARGPARRRLAALGGGHPPAALRAPRVPARRALAPDPRCRGARSGYRRRSDGWDGGDDRSRPDGPVGAPVGVGTAASPRLPRPVHRPDRVERRLDDAERRRGVADGRPLVLAHARGARPDRDAPPGLPHRPARGRAGGHLRPPPPPDRLPDLDAGDRRTAGHADLLGPGHARIPAVPDVLPRHRSCTDTAGVAGHPTGARAPCRVPAGHRSRRPHLQPGPGRRPCPRWCRRGRRRPAVGLPHQRRLVPGRRRRAPLVAPGRSGVQAAGGDDGRRHPGRDALRRQLVRVAPRPRSAPRSSCCQPPRCSACCR